MASGNRVDENFSWRPESFLTNSAGGKVAKKIGENDPFKVAANTKSGFGAIGSAFGWSSKSSRQKKHYEEALILKAWLEKQENIKKALERSQSGKLDEGEQASVTKYEKDQQSDVRRALSAMGAADSSARVGAEGAIDANVAAMKEGISEGWYLKAMKLKGMKEQSLEYLQKMGEEDRNARITDFSNLMAAVGAVGSLFLNAGD